MKNLFLFILCATTILLAFSCTKDEKTTIPLNGDYLPMQVQNYWEFQDFIKYAITGKKVIDNKTYYVFVQGSDTSYYRNENNKIFMRRSSGNESVKFDLSADGDKVWEFQDVGTTWRVSRSSKPDTLIINNTKIPNCYSFFFDIPTAIDDEHSIWLAPGIGFIKLECGFCPYPSLNLSRANINNIRITFP